MVRATFAGMSTALSALQANQKRLDLTGQNLANMNTPGYTRQTLQTSSLNYNNPISHYMNNSSLVAGFGVHMDKITQIRDPYLDVQYRNQIQKSGYTEAMQTSLDSLSKIFDESHVDGIWQAFTNIRSTLENLQDPSKVNDPIFESEFRSQMQALTNLLNDASNQIDEAEKVEYSKLDGTGTSEQGAVQQVNDILRQIGELNRRIKQNQIFGQESLELMDDRNVLLDELASYIPIEITYYKDLNYDGIDDGEDARYHKDAQGNIIGKREWPDDLRVEMFYQDENGTTKKLTLIEGTVGKGDENYGSVKISGGGLNDPTNVALTFYDYSENPATANSGTQFKKVASTAAGLTDASTASTAIGNHFPNGSGSIQASLDMLWKVGTTTLAGNNQEIENIKGYEFYRNQLNTLANTFATVMNTVNKKGAGSSGDLLAAKDSNPITAANITINPDWSSGKVHVGTAAGIGNQNDTVLNLIEAMKTTFSSGTTTIKGSGNSAGFPITFTGLNLENNTFADYINHVSAILSNDSYSNTSAFKTQMTVLNGIQDSRDSISGVSLDEEASNMMAYMSAYNAASRLMTTLDQALDVLINSTGTVGR